MKIYVMKMQDKSDFQNIVLSFMEIKGFPVEQYTILCFCVFKKTVLCFSKITNLCVMFVAFVLKSIFVKQERMEGNKFKLLLLLYFILVNLSCLIGQKVY